MLVAHVWEHIKNVNVHAQEEVPRPPQEEEFMLAQVNQMRRQIQAQQQAAAQKKARTWPCTAYRTPHD